MVIKGAFPVRWKPQDGKDGAKGETGANGCIVRQSEGWKSGAEYRNDSALTTDGVKYIDLIYIENSNASEGWYVYQCNVTHTATGTSFDATATDSSGKKLWVQLSNMSPLYTPLIVAKNAVLKFAQGQQFNLMNGNKVFGSMRYVDNGADFAFWLGGETGDDAPTSITRDGKLKAADAEISGKITATSGEIGGFTIENDRLKTEWSGTLTTTSGAELKKGSFWARSTVIKEVAMGSAAEYDPISEDHQKACDMSGTQAVSNAQNNTMIVRKYTSSNSIYNPVNNPGYAALNVDTDEGIGIRSIGGNLFGAIAQSVIKASTSLTTAQQTAINNNRVGILVMANSTEVTVNLPSSPIPGQTMLIIQQDKGKVNVNPGSNHIVWAGAIRTSSNLYYSGKTGQFNIFVYDGVSWNLQYINAAP